MDFRGKIDETLAALLSGELGGMTPGMEKQMLGSGRERIMTDVERIKGEISASMASAGGTFTGAATGRQAEAGKWGAGRMGDLQTRLALMKLQMSDANRQFALGGMMGIEEGRANRRLARRQGKRTERMGALSSIAKLAGALFAGPLGAAVAGKATGGFSPGFTTGKAAATSPPAAKPWGPPPKLPDLNALNWW